MIELNEVTDTAGTRYELAGLLGRGGQGAVYRVKNRPWAVKLADVRAPAAVRRVDESIARIRRYPLDGLHVARPLRALAAPHCGYVMELMTDMCPLSTICSVPREHADDLAPWYLDTGSLRRRLALLAAAGDLLAALHGRGLAYGDLSPHNVFVSEELDGREVWLIDCDNLSDGVDARAVYTPGYGAPELFRGRGADSLTDAWSFAVLTWELLCVGHPFISDEVHDGEPELEERAFRGELPWVLDPAGGTESTRGLPPSLVLTRRLRGLAANCFGESRTRRLGRPGVAAWRDALHQALDQLLDCPDCGSSYYLNNRCCPWCDEPRPAFVLGNVYSSDPQIKRTEDNPAGLVLRDRRPLLLHRFAVQSGAETEVGSWSLRGDAMDPEVLRAVLSDGSLVMSSDNGAGWALRHRAGTTRLTKLISRPQSFDLASGKRRWWLAPTDPLRGHRVVVFELVDSEGSDAP